MPSRGIFLSLFGAAGAPRVWLPDRAARATNNTYLNSPGRRFQGLMTGMSPTELPAGKVRRSRATVRAVLAAGRPLASGPQCA